MIYDLIIIGGGTAGAAGAVYAARKQLKTLIITTDFGGQSTVSSDIQNWIGTPSISGNDLAGNLKKHILAYADNIVDIKEGEKVTAIKNNDGIFSVTTDQKNVYQSKTILIAAGSSRRKITVPGADRLEHKGITYCASCDGPLFAGQDVAVIGGGNAGFETAAQLLAYCNSVTILHHGDAFKADPIIVEKVLKNPKMKALLNAETVEIYGETFVEGIKYKPARPSVWSGGTGDKKTGEIHDLKVKGIFVEIGQIPNTDFAKGLVDLDEYNRIKIDPWTQKTSTPGIWAAGDCTTVLYHQNNIAAGDAVKALENIYLYLHARTP